MSKYTSIVGCLAVTFLLAACRVKDEVVYTTDPVANVEALWQIIDTKYCYIDDKGIDWSAIHDEYIGKAALLKEDDRLALFDLCAAMLDSLRDGHVNLYSPFDRSYNTAWYDTLPVNFSSGLQALYLHDYRIAGGLYYCTIDEGRVGYIYYSSFSDNISAGNLAWIASAFSECRGLIVDVRNNGGGDITNAYRLAAPFFTDNQVIGYWQHKTGPGHKDFSSMEPMTLDLTSLPDTRWQKPVVVLCNRRTYSAANLFVSMMRYAPQAVIVGGTSGGGGGMPMSYEMPCGWMVRFSSVRMFDRDKSDIEQGIRPDVPVTMQSDDKDDIIERAIELINSKTGISTD